MPSTPDPEEILTPDTAALLHDIDWANTPLGPIEHWSDELRIQADLIARTLVRQRHGADEATVRDRAQMDAVIDMLPIPLIVLSPSRQIIRQNTAAKRWFARLGITRSADTQLLDAITRDVLPYEAWPPARALAGDTTQAKEYLVRVIATGEEVPCLVFASPVTVDGQIVGAVSLIQEITTLKEVERAKDEFLALLTHELNTPLTNMLGWSHQALHHGDPALILQAMEIVHRNALRQKRLVSEMLDLSRLIHHKIDLQREATDLGLLTRKAVKAVVHQAEMHSLQLRLELPEEPLPIHADPQRLLQCIGNLLDNGLKFTPPDGTVTVRCSRAGDWAVLAVQDTGRGIAPEALPTVFEAFRQVNRDERAGGLGLGLAVARGIVEMHRGRVTAASPGIGQGSTFTITLPLRKA